MGDLFGGGGDGGAAERAMAEQQKETARLRAQTEAEKRDMLEKQQSGLKLVSVAELVRYCLLSVLMEKKV